MTIYTPQEMLSIAESKTCEAPEFFVDLMKMNQKCVVTPHPWVYWSVCANVSGRYLGLRLRNPIFMKLRRHEDLPKSVAKLNSLATSSWMVEGMLYFPTIPQAALIRKTRMKTTRRKAPRLMRPKWRQGGFNLFLDRWPLLISQRLKKNIQSGHKIQCEYCFTSSLYPSSLM